MCSVTEEATLPRLAGEDPEGYEIEASFVRSVDLVE